MKSAIYPVLLLGLWSASGAAAIRTVTETHDNGDGVCDATCTLRDALTAIADGDRVLFALSLPNPVNLDLVGQPLEISVPIRIVGTDGVPTTLRRTGGSGRLMQVRSGGDVRIVGLSFANGAVVTAFDAARGGAILVDPGATLEVRDGEFRNNEVRVLAPPGILNTAQPASGGAIAADGDLLIEGCTFIQNTARGGDLTGQSNLMQGAPGLPGGSAFGGAIAATGALSVINSTFTGNAAIAGNGGGGGVPPFPMMPGGNGGPGGDGRGGALHVGAAATADISFSTLIANSATPGNGGPGGSPDAVAGAAGIAAGAALQGDAAMTINTSVIASNGNVSVSGCAGAALTARTSNRVDDSGCPGVTVPGLAMQFEPGNSAVHMPVFRPSLGSAVIDTSPDCLDALGVEAVDLDQLLAMRPLFGGVAPGMCDFGAIEFNIVQFGDGFEDPPPPPEGD